MHLAPKKAPNKQDCVYRKGKKSDIPDENLLSKTSKVSKKFCCNFMVWCNQNNNSIKVNKDNYCRHLHKELFPATEKIVKREDWIFAQDGGPSHRGFIRAEE